MNILTINTANNLITTVELEKNGQKFKVEEKRGKPGDQNVLELIEKLLQEQSIALKDIDSVNVNAGPGSFTGLRVGVTIANALAFGITVSVNGKPLGEIETPIY